MRDLPPEFLNKIAKRGPIVAKTFVVFVARNRTTGASERLCLWNGDDTQQFNIEGTTETFYGAGSIIKFDDIIGETGTNPRKMLVELSQLTPEVALLVRGYDVKRAKVRIYTVLFSNLSGLQITPALRRFKGFVDKAPIRTPPKNQRGNARVELVSIARNLTRLIPSKRSDENQRLRNSNDAFFQYVTTTGMVQTVWGALAETPAAGSRGIARREFTGDRGANV